LKRHLFALLTTLVIIATGVTACVQQPTAQRTPASTSTTIPAKTPVLKTPEPTSSEPEIKVDIKALDGIQIQFLHPWVGDTQTELIQMVDQFNQTNEWGIHVIMNAPGSAAMVTSKVWEEIANNNQSNIIVAPISLLLAIDENEELIVDLQPYINSPGFGLKTAEIEDYTPIFWDEDLVEGKRLGIPAQRSALLMAYNTTWAGELGFTAPPQTAEQFRNQVCAANASFRKDEDETNDGLGGWLVNTDSPVVYSWMVAFGAVPFSNDRYIFNNSADEEAFTYLLDLKTDSCAWVSRTTQDAEYFASRKALAYPLWMQDLRALDNTLQRNASEDQWTVIPWPGNDEQPVVTSGSSYAVLHNSPEEDLASWLFIRWLSQPVQQDRLLQTFGTLPLGSAVLNLIRNTAEFPQWQTAIHYSDLFITQPVDADWQAVSPVLEDAAWQLLMTEVTAEQIPAILEQMDTLATELAERYP
jgi:ABC-type glycerol-3-phosphate transport system substrate-binding protein